MSLKSWRYLSAAILGGMVSLQGLNCSALLLQAAGASSHFPSLGTSLFIINGLLLGLVFQMWKEMQ